MFLVIGSEYFVSIEPAVAWFTVKVQVKLILTIKSFLNTIYFATREYIFLVISY